MDEWQRFKASSALNFSSCGLLRLRFASQVVDPPRSNPQVLCRQDVLYSEELKGTTSMFRLGAGLGFKEKYHKVSIYRNMLKISHEEHPKRPEHIRIIRLIFTPSDGADHPVEN